MLEIACSGGYIYIYITIYIHCIVVTQINTYI